MSESFSRIISLLGEEEHKLIEAKHVMIIGLGGVGGYAAEAIARCGVSEITIVDNDCVEKSNINRQIIALNDNLGKLKTDCFKERISHINPQTIVHCVNKFITPDNISQLFDKKIDYVIDAIDTMTTKVFLWKYCQLNHIKFISSLGTAKKLDPSKLRVTTLDKTQNDPMAKALRTIARKNEVSLKVPVVFSEEQPINNDIKLGSMIFVPAVAGLYCANYVIIDIINKNDAK